MRLIFEKLDHQQEVFKSSMLKQSQADASQVEKLHASVSELKNMFMEMKVDKK